MSLAHSVGISVLVQHRDVVLEIFSRHIRSDPDRASLLFEGRGFEDPKTSTLRVLPGQIFSPSPLAFSVKCQHRTWCLVQHSMRYASEHQAGDSLPAPCAHENQIRSQCVRLLQDHGGRCPAHGDSVCLIPYGANTFCHTVDEACLPLQELGSGCSGCTNSRWRICRGQYGQQGHLNCLLKRLKLEKTNCSFGIG